MYKKSREVVTSRQVVPPVVVCAIASLLLPQALFEASAEVVDDQSGDEDHRHEDERGRRQPRVQRRGERRAFARPCDEDRHAQDNRVQGRGVDQEFRNVATRHGFLGSLGSHSYPPCSRRRRDACCRGPLVKILGSAERTGFFSTLVD